MFSKLRKEYIKCKWQFLSKLECGRCGSHSGFSGLVKCHNICAELGRLRALNSAAHALGGTEKGPEQAPGGRTHHGTLGSTCWVCITQFTFPTCQSEHGNVFPLSPRGRYFWKVMWRRVLCEQTHLTHRGTRCLGKLWWILLQRRKGHLKPDAWGRWHFGWR